jgi:hypothetical protein
LGDADRREMMEVLAQYDAPAYVRRARGVEEALQRLVERARRQRTEWLAMARLRVGELLALAGAWEALAALVADGEQLASLERLHAELAPKLRLPPEPTTSARVLRGKLRELCASLERFNRRWRRYLDEIDLGEVNELRAGYNRYYLLEKECAMRSPTLARQGYRPLEMLSLADVEALLPPPQPLPRLRA